MPRKISSSWEPRFSWNPPLCHERAPFERRNSQFMTLLYVSEFEGSPNFSPWRCSPGHSKLYSFQHCNLGQVGRKTATQQNVQQPQQMISQQITIFILHPIGKSEISLNSTPLVNQIVSLPILLHWNYLIWPFSKKFFQLSSLAHAVVLKKTRRGVWGFVCVS